MPPVAIEMHRAGGQQRGRRVDELIRQQLDQRRLARLRHRVRANPPQPRPRPPARSAPAPNRRPDARRSRPRTSRARRPPARTAPRPRSRPQPSRGSAPWPGRAAGSACAVACPPTRRSQPRPRRKPRRARQPCTGPGRTAPARCRSRRSRGRPARRRCRWSRSSIGRSRSGARRRPGTVRRTRPDGTTLRTAISGGAAVWGAGRDRAGRSGVIGRTPSASPLATSRESGVEPRHRTGPGRCRSERALRRSGRPGNCASVLAIFRSARGWPCSVETSKRDPPGARCALEPNRRGLDILAQVAGVRLGCDHRLVSWASRSTASGQGGVGSDALAVRPGVVIAERSAAFAVKGRTPPRRPGALR